MTEKKQEYKFCPFAKRHCAGDICALWDVSLPGCAVLSIAKELAMIREDAEARRKVKIEEF